MRVRDLLALFPELTVVAGAAGLERPVRWVHVVEQPDVAHWLRSGDFVLNSGVSWPLEPVEQAKAVRQMVDVGVAGVLFATGRFLETVPDVVRTEAEAASLAVMEAPFQLRFADIAEAAQRTIFSEYFEVTERADAIHRALTLAATQAVDLEELADRLETLLSVEVAIYGHDGALLARAQDSSAGTKPLPAKALADVARASTDELPLHLRVRDQEVLVMPVRQGTERCGYLLLRKTSGTFGPLEERVIQHAAAVIAMHILRQNEIADVEWRIHASFLEALLGGAYSPHDRAARERVRMHGLDPDARFRVVIARLDFAGPALTSHREFELRREAAGIMEAHVRTTGVHVLTTLMLSRVVLLWPAGPDDRVLLQQLFRRAQAAVGGRLFMAVGEAQTGIGGIPQSYAQAEQLLQWAGTGESFMVYEDQLLVQLLASVDDGALRAFHDAVLGAIERDRSGAALVQTAQALAASGGSQVRAAQALGIHRNTLRQRIQRLEKILGRSLTDPETFTRLQLAWMAGRLLVRHLA